MSKFDYNKALVRLNEIVVEIESNGLDINKISKLTKESNTLLKACKKAISSTKDEINEVVNQMNQQLEES